jgi:ribonucleoside-diphosphate reductase alpha chain
MTEQYNNSTTDRIETSCGHMYITIVWTKEGKLKNIFAHLGKSGGCAASQLDALSYLAKVSIRAGVPVKTIVKGLRGIGCHIPSEAATSCADAFSRIVEKRLGNDTTSKVK